MKVSISPVWNSFSLLTRLSIQHSHKYADGPGVFYILRFISLAQTLLLMFGNIQFNTHKTRFLIQPLSRFLKELIGFGRLANLLEMESSVLMVIIFLLIYFFFLILAILTSFSLYYKQPYVSKPILFVSKLTTLHAEILFYPLSYSITAIMEIILQNKFTLIQKEVSISILSMLFFLNVLITLFKTFFCYNCTSSKKLISRKGSLHLLSIAILKLFLPILQLSSLQSRDLFKIAGITISLVISIYLLQHTILSLPEYDVKLTKMHIIFNSIAVCLTIGQLISLISNDDGLILNLTLLVLSFWIKLNLIFYRRITRNLTYFPESLRNKTFLANLEAIYTNVERNLQLDSTNKRFPKESLKTFSLILRKLETFEMNRKIYPNQPEILNKDFAFFLKKLFEGLPTKSLLSPLCSLSYAKLILKHFHMVPRAYSRCLLALNSKLRIPYRISVYEIVCKVQKVIQKEKISKSEGSLSFQKIWECFLAEKAFDNLQTSILEYTQNTISYWTVFKGEQPKILTLITKAKALNKQKFNIEKQWKKFEARFAENLPLAYLLYGTFQTHFLNRPWEGTEKLRKYNCLAFNKGNLDETPYLEQEESAVIMVASERKKTGSVLNVSENFEKAFNIDKKIVVGHNISKIMPRFFAERHNDFIIRYYETGRSCLMGKETKQYAKDKYNNVFPISMTLALQLSAEHGIIYTALIKKINEQNEYILFTEDGIIQETSEKLRTMLDLEPDKKVNIQSICSGYDVGTDSMASVEIKVKQNKTAVSLLTKTSEKIDNKQKFKVSNLTYPTKSSVAVVPMKFNVKIEDYYYDGNYLKVMVLTSQENASRNTINLQPTIQTQIDEKNEALKTELAKSSEDILHNSTFSRVPTETKNLFTTVTNTKYLNTDVYPLIEKKDTEKGKSEKSNESSNACNPVTSSFSDKLKASKISLEAQNRVDDNLQDMYETSYSTTHNRLTKGVFVLFLLMSLIMVLLQYLTFQQSVKDISFAVKVVRNSYERLNSLSWIYRFAIRYQAIVDGIVTVSTKELDRYKVIIGANRELLRIANNELLNTITTGNERQRNNFFKENIVFNYGDKNDTPNALQHRELNSFEAINLFIEKLMQFDTTPHSTLIMFGNPDLEFVRKNAANSLLMFTEELIEITKSNFADKVTEKKKLSIAVFGLSIPIAIIASLIAVIASRRDFWNLKRLFKTLLFINYRDIDKIVLKLETFNKILVSKEKLMSSKSYSSKKQFESSKAKSTTYSQSPKKCDMKTVVSMKVKQCLFIILVLCCIFLINFVEFDFATILFDELIETNNRFILISKARYAINMASTTVFDLIVFRNTTTIRNESLVLQLERNIDDIVANDALIKEFTDSSGEFVDSRFQTIFQGKPCPLVVNYPGSNNFINCPRATNNQTIGILALNAQFPQDIYAIGKEMIDDLSIQNSKVMFPKMVSFLDHKTSTIVGAYVFVIDLLNEIFQDQVNSIFDSDQSRLALEICGISLLGLIGVWFLANKILDDSLVRIILKTIPYEVTRTNKLLQNLIKNLYKERQELLNFNNQLA